MPNGPTVREAEEEAEMLSPKLIVSVMLLAAALAGGFGRTRVRPAAAQKCSMFSPCAQPSEDPIKP